MKINSISQFDLMKNKRNEESFIEKMKRQYLGDENKSVNKSFDFKKQDFNQNIVSN